MLAAVISQMKDVPAVSDFQTTQKLHASSYSTDTDLHLQVDYQEVGNAVGIAYKGNAKRAFKKVWEKLGGSASSGNTPRSAKSECSQSAVTPKKRNVQQFEEDTPSRGPRPQRKRKMSQKGIDAKLVDETYPSEFEDNDKDEGDEKDYEREKQHLWKGTPDSGYPDSKYYPVSFAKAYY